MTQAERSTIWQRITEPSAGLEDPVRRQRARVLAAVTLTLLVANLIALIAAIVFVGDVRIGSAASPIALAVLYAASRTSRPELGAGGAVAALIVTITALLALSPMVGPVLLVAFVLPLLFSVLVLQARLVTIFAVATVLAIIGLFLFDPEWVFTAEAYMLPSGIVAIVLVMVVAIGLLREGDLRIIREQGGEVEQYSRKLEVEVQTRTQNIMSVAEIGRQMAETRDLERLMRRTVELIVANFDFYHAQVFLLDEAEQYAVLRASTGTAGRKLLERNHRLAKGSQSVIGQVITRDEPVIALDTDTDAVHRRNELLPNTRSEMALPLKASGRVIGALDIQSTAPNAFGQADIPIFQTLADQLAVAIERIRLFDRTQQDIAQIEVLNQQLTGEAWGRFMAGREEPLGYRMGMTGLEAIDEPDEGEEATIELPLSVRGETIGQLEIASRDGSVPDPDTQYMLQAVAERVAQALDTTRLGEQSRRQAEQEQILSRLSADLQASGDLQTVLRIAAEQASRALGTSRGFVHLSLRLEGGDVITVDGSEG